MTGTGLVEWTRSAITVVREAAQFAAEEAECSVWVDHTEGIYTDGLHEVADYVGDASVRLHMVLNAPRAVLDRCDADQRIIDRHKPWLNHGRFSDGYFLECDEFCSHKLGHVYEFVCCECRTETGDPLTWPCGTYRDVASGYRHQVPGWQEEWAT